MTRQTALIICGIFVIVMSLVAFVAYGIDKAKAKKGSRRTPEKVLLTLSLVGGGIGGLVGMFFFRHKTRAEHWYFYAVNVLGIAVCAGLFALALIAF